MVVELTDELLLNLSKRITNEEELMDLGVKVFRGSQITSYNQLFMIREEIQPAAQKVLKYWLKKQENREKALTAMRTSLQENEMNLLVDVLSSSVQGSRNSQELPDNSTCINKLLII